ncbi:HAD-IIIC family phosphatase [Kitasatospora sp. NBC_01287]|uniref:HAD-IIIC family phosphatase n=1 Tax=Kitasatospora sp. NBC_01287 TaxID=2903573 RepID=UPI002253172C|nr:HAD-IIIC family phosphatase [Kitasatospora sp. NBC_01287]MCX4750334.1 HAD-IIIC family phosphatase [Kitasatospora sp. NBC_01287]
MSAVIERLRELRAQGRLERDYDQVAPLLAGCEELATGDLDAARVGRLLAAADPAAVLAHHPGTRALTVAVTGESTVGELLDPLTAELARHGLLLRPLLGDHGAWQADLTSPAGAFAGTEPELTLCLLDAETVFAAVPTPWRVADVEQAAAQALRRLTAVLDGRTTGGLLVLNTLPLPAHWARQLVDYHARARLGAVWREFNAELLRLSADRADLVVLDLDPLLAEGGPLCDPRLACYAGARLGAALLAGYAREAAQLARALTGRTRKALVLDLDQTLWDGILDEDGPEGIAAAGTLRGAAFGRFQRGIAQLAAQGVLLAISSKNEDAAVGAVLRDHPDLALRPEHFAAVNANWLPKDGNLREIAQRLGLGLDALVFVDDSPAERAQVRHGAPGVAVVPIDEEPALHLRALLRDGWFATLRLTEEDRERPARYRQEQHRAARRTQVSTYQDFLYDLEIWLEIGPPRGYELARLAQLTQRTNQFNLTGARLPEAELARHAAGPDGDLLLAVRSGDRFGDHGLVGALLGRRAPDGLHLDHLWLSCRVLARGIEQACLAALLARARAEGQPAVHAHYLPTPKNHRAAGFYPSLGFSAADRPGPGVDYRHDLRSIPDTPGHLQVKTPEPEAS